jgi:hypothetical protein
MSPPDDDEPQDSMEALLGDGYSAQEIVPDKPEPSYIDPAPRGERTESLLSDRELLQIGRRLFRTEAAGHDGEKARERARAVMDALDEILADKSSRQRLGAASLMHKILTQDPEAEENKPTINANAAFVGTPLTPQLLAELERQQLQANEAKYLEANDEEADE